MNARLAVRLLKLAEPTDPAFDKLLSDNRELYMQQSKQTRNGVVAQFPSKPLRPNNHVPAMAG